MNFNTIESDYEYNIKDIFAQFKSAMETDLKGEELQQLIWDNRELLGELFFNSVCEYTDIDELTE